MRFIPNPIRAEISDLYNTILLGIDCLLITSEIIAGLYPFETIDTISNLKIIKNNLNKKRILIP
jgi:pyruvate kinase